MKNNKNNNNKHQSEILNKMAERGKVEQKAETSNTNNSAHKGAAPSQNKPAQQGKPAQGQQEQKPVQGQQKPAQQQSKTDNFKKNK